MPVRYRRHFHRPGLPEITGGLLVALVLVGAGFWGSALQVPNWQETGGEIIDCEIQAIHYNATDNMQKVSLQYRYHVGPAIFYGAWSGEWPEAESPNALPPDHIEELKQPAHPLVVLYDPVDPSISQLHYIPAANPNLYAYLTLLAAFAALFYFSRVYPRWREP